MEQNLHKFTNISDDRGGKRNLDDIQGFENILAKLEYLMSGDLFQVSESIHSPLLSACAITFRFDFMSSLQSEELDRYRNTNEKDDSTARVARPQQSVSILSQEHSGRHPEMDCK